MKYLPVIFIILGISLHIVFALAIYMDAQELERRYMHVFVGAPAWAVTVLVFGLFAVLVYWLIHHSNLRRTYRADTKLFDPDLDREESKNHMKINDWKESD